MAKKRIYKSRQLIRGYIEGISSKVFAEFPKAVTELAGGEHGVYALYKNDHLYYIGLAANLKSRVKNHLHDKHAGKWNYFSLYLVRKADHIKELESIIMRISDPKGNSVRGKLHGASNLEKTLDAKMKKEQEHLRDELLKKHKPARKIIKRQKKQKARKASAKSPAKHQAALAEYVIRPFKIRGKYKGEYVTAVVRRDGSIRLAKGIYNSPSLAQKAVTKHSVNGWTFWRYRNKKGEWVKLDTLRKK